MVYWENVFLNNLTLFLFMYYLADIKPNSINGSYYCQAELFALFIWIADVIAQR